MKKLCRKGTVHPSPPFISDFLSFLPAAIFTLTVALSPDDKEVLAYLISCSNSSGSRKSVRKLAAGGKVGVDHAPLFDCDCFMCYRRYWARWDSSPNRQLIHEVIDAYEDGLLAKSKSTATTQRSCKKDRRKQKSHESGPGESNRSELSLGRSKVNEVSASVAKKETGRGDEEEEEEVEEDGEERGSVRRFVSFVGEKIWSAWG